MLRAALLGRASLSYGIGVDGNCYIETAWAYIQLAAELRELVAGMQPHAPLPSLRHLSHDYGHAPKTVRRALQVLIDDGLIYVQPYKGFYVRPR
jgi:GntR family transcriptional regulator